MNFGLAVLIVLAVLVLVSQIPLWRRNKAATMERGQTR